MTRALDKDETHSFAFDDGNTTPRVAVLCEDTFSTFDLPTSGRLVVGRTKDCDIRIDHRSVSRAHAALHIGPIITVEDLGSANGTRLNGRRLDPHRPEPLVPGAVVEVGRASLVLRGASRPTTASDPARGIATAAMAPGQPVRAMDRLRQLADLVAEGTLPVLLLGETGVGKEAMAELIHARSPRHGGPLVKINCAALPETLLESELFGNEKGAFSGALSSRPGLVETAHKGTLFLDEVGEMSLATQAKMLRVLESREVTRVGAVRPRSVDVRFIAATNRDLQALVEVGEFRRDVYHRLSGMTLTIPPLRERVDEIVHLANLFVGRVCDELGRPRTSIEPAAIAWLERQPWPGNVRELRNVAERAVMLSRGAPIGIEHVQDPLGSRETNVARTPSGLPPPSLRGELDAIERARIEDALVRMGGNQTKAAQLLGISRRTLIGRLNTYDLPRPRRPSKERP